MVLGLAIGHFLADVVGQVLTIQLPESTVSTCGTTNAMATWPVVSPVAPTTPASSTRGVTDPGGFGFRGGPAGPSRQSSLATNVRYPIAVVGDAWYPGSSVC